MTGHVTLDSFILAFTAPDVAGSVVASEWAGRTTDWREEFTEVNRWAGCTHAPGSMQYTNGYSTEAFSYWTDSPGACFEGLVCATDGGGTWSRCITITYTDTPADVATTSVVNMPADICIKEFGVGCSKPAAGGSAAEAAIACCGVYMTCEDRESSTDNYTQCIPMDDPSSTAEQTITGIDFVHVLLPPDSGLWTYAMDGLGQVCDFQTAAACNAAAAAAAASSQTVVGHAYKPLTALPFDYAVVFSGILIKEISFFPTASSNLKFGYKITSPAGNFVDFATGASTGTDLWSQAATSVDNSCILDVWFDRSDGSITLKVTQLTPGIVLNQPSASMALTVTLTIYDQTLGEETIVDLETIELTFVPFAITAWKRTPPGGLAGTAADSWLTSASHYPSNLLVDGTYLFGPITLDSGEGIAGDSISFSLQGAPAGLFAEASTGMIAGSPASSGVRFSMDVVATDLAGHSVVLETIAGATAAFEVGSYQRVDDSGGGLHRAGVLTTAGGYSDLFYADSVARWGELQLNIPGIGAITGGNNMGNYSFYVEQNPNGCMIDSNSGAVQCAFTETGHFSMFVWVRDGATGSAALVENLEGNVTLKPDLEVIWDDGASGSSFNVKGFVNQSVVLALAGVGADVDTAAGDAGDADHVDGDGDAAAAAALLLPLVYASGETYRIAAPAVSFNNNAATTPIFSAVVDDVGVISAGELLTDSSTGSMIFVPNANVTSALQTLFTAKLVAVVDGVEVTQAVDVFSWSFYVGVQDSDLIECANGGKLIEDGQHFDGAVECACLDGYSGDLCTMKDAAGTSAVTIAVSSVAAVLLIILAVGAIILRGRHRVKNAPHSFSAQLEQLKADGLIMPAAEGDQGAELLIGGGSGITPRELHFSQIAMNKKLGSGQFGEVWSAKLSFKGMPSYPVAVKVVKEGAPAEERDALLEESALMAQFQDGPVTTPPTTSFFLLTRGH